MGSWRYLELRDYLLIAEDVLDVPARDIARFPRIALAESALAAPAAGYGGEDAYLGFEDKAAVLCWHLIQNHPLPDGNKRAGFLALVEFCELNERPWRRSRGDLDRTVEMIEAVAAGEVDVSDLARWVGAHTSDEGRKGEVA